ncbi:hypothetical protein phiSA039_0138 [Staphylococcus phage phiSA039]|nr:hypothetical protein phiSA039_0138 [Staphylococcus phage phiSA039]
MSKDKPNRRKEIQHQPVNFAPTNTLTGANNSFFAKKPSEPKDATSVIEYRILFIKRFDNVTSTDVKLQKKYALNLISEALDVKETYLSLKQKGKKQNLFCIQIEFIMFIEVKNLLESVVSENKEHLKVNI